MSPKKAGSVWHACFIAPPGTGAPFGTALEAFSEQISYLEIEEDGPYRVECWSEDALDAGAVEAAVNAVAHDLGVETPVVTVEQEPTRDWLAENLASFQPLRIGRFYLSGTHVTDPPPSGVVSIRLDAGLAFGTGEHASTAGCLTALDDLAKRHRFDRVLDMGAGSGVLGIAAAKAFGASVLAAEIDRRSVRVCAANASLNDVAARMRSVQSRGYVTKGVQDAAPYNLIFANILCRPLCGMARDLARHLAPGGRAILSGFLVRDARRVLSAHRSQGLVLDGSVTRDGWRTLVLRKPIPK